MTRAVAAGWWWANARGTLRVRGLIVRISADGFVACRCQARLVPKRAISPFSSDTDVGDLDRVESEREGRGGSRADDAGLPGPGHGQGLREGNDRLRCVNLPLDRPRPSCSLFGPVERRGVSV